jgi:hypothetical protein
VSVQVSLPIAIDVEAPYGAPALNLCFPDAGVDDLSLPRDVPRQADIDRKQASHRALLLRLQVSSSIILLQKPANYPL